jgi:hypothetical protein
VWSLDVQGESSKMLQGEATVPDEELRQSRLM